MTTKNTTETMTTPNTDTEEREPSDAEREAMFREASDKRDATKASPAVDQPIVESRDEPEPVAAAPVATPTPAAHAPTPPAAPNPAPAPAAPVVEKSFDDMTPDELRAAAKKERHERMAAVGRTAALQREKEARDRAAAAPRAPAPAPLPESQRLSTAFPELNSAVAHAIDERTRAVQQQIQQQIVKTNLDTLSAMFGEGWVDTMQSNEFHAWLSQQPATEQQKYHSDSPADYAGLLRGYEKASSSSPTTSPAAAPTEAERVAASRQMRVTQNESAPRGRSTVGSKTTGEPDAESDPDGLFRYLSAKRDLGKGGQPRR